MKEKNSIYSARASSNQTTKTFWYDRQGRLCPGGLDSNLFFTKAKGILYLRRWAGLSRISCTFLSLCIFFVLFPDVQLSSISLPTSRLRSLSRFKSKSKPNRHLSSNAFSHSFSPHSRQRQTHHHKCLPQDSESLCVRPHRQPQSRI